MDSFMKYLCTARLGECGRKDKLKDRMIEIEKFIGQIAVQKRSSQVTIRDDDSSGFSRL